MSIVLGVRPGGRNSFAVSALWWQGRLPARLIATRAHSGVRAVLYDLLGIYGEWGEPAAAVIDAPLTWGDSANGWRKCDTMLRERAPAWVPKSWVRSPHVVAGSVGIQGPSLTWALAAEAKRGNFPKHPVVEGHSRVSMARSLRDLSEPILGYRRRENSAADRRKHIARIVDRVIDAGVVALEVEPPDAPEQLEALVCAVTALAYAYPESGLVCHEFPGAPIRPVGRRPVVVLDALP